jgi:hypothetical protein
LLSGRRVSIAASGIFLISQVEIGADAENFLNATRQLSSVAQKGRPLSMHLG